MRHREEITAELQQIDPLMTQWSFETPYRAPADYFVVLPERILELAITGLPVERKTGYQIPIDYFDHLSENILAFIHQQEVKDELEELAPILNQVTKTMPYSQTRLPIMNMEAIMEQAAVNKIPVIQMPVRKAHKWMQYAAAAIVAGVLITTAFLYNESDHSTGEPTVANYAQMDVSKEITKLTEEELDTYLTTTEKLVVTTADREQYGIDDLLEVDEHIQLTSDDELKQYLNESAEASTEESTDTNS